MSWRTQGLTNNRLTNMLHMVHDLANNRLTDILHVDVRGDGPDAVLLHGWAMNGAVWGEFADTLAARLRLHIVDLPGHGFSHNNALTDDVKSTLQRVSNAVPTHAHWIGWSLGGMLALYAAQQIPDAVERLVLIGTSPSFVASPCWPHGMTEEVFAGFGQQLQSDIPATLRRFLALQMLGLRDAQTRARDLAQHCLTRPIPTRESLENGLTLLRATQLHNALPTIRQPTLIIQGSLDRLVSPDSARELSRRLQQAQLAEISNAGHAPFVSHCDTVAQRVLEFLL